MATPLRRFTNVYFTGTQLHGVNKIYRLVNFTNQPLLTHNMISSHRAFKLRKERSTQTRFNNHSNLANNLSNFIFSKLKNHPSETSHRALAKMVNTIINHRQTNQLMHRADYIALERDLQHLLSQVNTLHRQNPNAKKYRNIKERVTNIFVNNPIVLRYRDHVNQISYWKWIKNSVLGRVATKLKQQRINMHHAPLRP